MSHSIVVVSNLLLVGDIINEIFSHLDAKSLGMASRVCKVFKIIADQETFWMKIVSEGGLQTKVDYEDMGIYCRSIGDLLEVILEITVSSVAHALRGLQKIQ
jgi:hypothetical protein